MLWKTIDWILEKLKIIGAVCLVGMTFLTCADVIGRLFLHPIFGSVEIVAFMATLSVAMALPYTHKIKGHVGVQEIHVQVAETFDRAAAPQIQFPIEPLRDLPGSGKKDVQEQLVQGLVIEVQGSRADSRTAGDLPGRNAPEILFREQVPGG